MTSVAPFRENYASYLRAGWGSVIPIERAGALKKPPLSGFTGRERRTPTDEDYARWLNSELGDHNFAVPIPDGYVALDIDKYHNGHITLARLEEELGELPHTPRYLSGSGNGYHLVFRCDTRLKGGVAGIETLQYHHRYQLGAGSIHDVTGNEYVWEDGVVPTLSELPDLPEAWVEYLKADSQDFAEFSNEEYDAWITEHGQGEMCSVMSGLVDGFEPEASRHDEYMHRLYAVLKHVQEGHPGGEEAVQALYLGFIDSVGDDRGDLDSEWSRMLKVPSGEVSEIDPCEHPFAGLIDYADFTTPVLVVTNSAGDDHTSWWPQNLLDAISGDVEENNKPRYLQRDDDESLLYPGQINGFIGESESGKSWCAMLATLQAMQNGENVAYYDFEDNRFSVVERFKLMGASDEDLTNHLAYVSPDEPLSGEASEDLKHSLERSRPSVIVVDGVNSAMTLMGLELESNSDATRFTHALLKPLTKLGATVITVDHVPKSKDSRGKGGIGAQAKRAMLSGAAFRVEVIKPFGRGMCGELKLTVDKDRPGYVRKVSRDASYAGTVIIDSSEDSVNMYIRAPEALTREEVKESRASREMSLVYAYVVENAGSSQNAVITAKPGNLGKNAIVKALTGLISGGFLAVQTGDRGAKIHALTDKPYAAEFEGLT